MKLQFDQWQKLFIQLKILVIMDWDSNIILILLLQLEDFRI